MAAKRTIVIISGTVLVLLLLGALGLASVYRSMLLPVDAGAAEKTVTVEIPAGAGTGEIASILKENGIIRNTWFFRLYSRWHGLDRNFIAGSYHLSPSMGLEEVVELICSGDVYRETEWFTIPEGFTIEQIAERLGSSGLVDEARFLDLSRQPSPDLMERFPFLQAIDDSNIEYVLEGYLFPDTYEIAAGASEEEIIALMLRRLETVYTEAYRQRAHELGLSMHQALTLASIVEREGRVDRERPLIAGVFHNRLAVNHPLQSCATVQYVLGEVKEVLLNEDLEIPSPYNTYLHAGLPPGPIAAPGEASIRAALYPEKTEYFYFVYKEDGSGEHYFARTLSEHNANTERARQNRNSAS